LTLLSEAAAFLRRYHFSPLDDACLLLTPSAAAFADTLIL